MRKILLLLTIVMITNLSFAASFTCNPDSTSGDDGQCDKAANSDPSVTISFSCPWGFSTAYTSSSCPSGKSDDCYSHSKLADPNIINTLTMCNMPSLGTAQAGYCYSKTGDCPSGTASITEACNLNAYDCATYTPAVGAATTICYYFRQTFTKRSDSISNSLSTGAVCTNTDVWTYLMARDATQLSKLTGAWCTDDGVFKGIRDSIAYCFKTTCGDNGWSANPDTSCNCNNQNLCLTSEPCVGTNKNICYAQYSCTTSGAWSTSDPGTITPDIYAIVESGYCKFSPVCTATGSFSYSAQSNNFYYNDGTTDTFTSCSLMVDTTNQGKGDLCSQDANLGYYYDDTHAYCYHSVKCTSCNPTYTKDELNYCNSISSLGTSGGYAGVRTYCPTPGTISPDGTKCYYNPDYNPVSPDYHVLCTKFGCNVKYGLMVGGNYECDPVIGPVLKTPELTPPETKLQSIPSLMIFGYQDVAILSAEGASDVASCSCLAQDLMQREPFCDFGLYPNNYQITRSSIFMSTAYTPPYNNVNPYDYDNSLKIFNNCTCVFPDKRLIEGIRWAGNSYYDKRLNDDVCKRLFGTNTNNCYWKYDAPLISLNPWHGSDLSNTDCWNTLVQNGNTCNNTLNRIFRFNFDINALIDIRASIYDRGKTVPVYLTTFSNGELVSSGDKTIESITKLSTNDELTFSFELNSDASSLGFNNASISLYCPEGGFRLTVNNVYETATIACLDNPWITYYFNEGIIPQLVSGINTIKLTAVTDTYLGVDEGADNTWLNPNCNSASPITTNHATGTNYLSNNLILVSEGNRIILNEKSLTHALTGITDIEVSNVGETKQYGDLHILTNGLLTTFLNWDFSNKLESPATLITGTFNELYTYHEGVISNNGITLTLPGVTSMTGSPKAMFAITPDNVYLIRRNFIDSSILSSYALPLSDGVTVNTIVDFDKDGDDDFIGLQGNEIQIWLAQPFGPFKKQLYTPHTGVTMISAGDFIRTGKNQILIRDTTNDYLYIENTSPALTVNVNGANWQSIGSTLYTKSGNQIIKNNYFKLSCPTSTNTLFYSFLVRMNDAFSSLDLLFPNINAPLNTVSFTGDYLGRENLILGKTLICGTDINIKLELKSYETLLKYDKVGVSVKLNDTRIQCVSPSVSDCEGDYYCGNPNTVPISEDGLGKTIIKCKLPPCDPGLPEFEQLSICIKAGEFEYENCYALQTIQPLASDPTGLSITDVKINNIDTATQITQPLATCNPVTVDVYGKITDSKNSYTKIGQVTAKQGTATTTNVSDLRVGTEILLFKGLTINPSQALTITGSPGDYYETNPASVTITCSTCSAQCSSGQIQCATATTYRTCDTSSGCGTWGTTTTSCPDTDSNPCINPVCSSNACSTTISVGLDCGPPSNPTAGDCANAGGQAVCRGGGYDDHTWLGSAWD